MRAAAALLVVALVVRLAVIGATSDYQPVQDPQDYDRIARSLAAGDGFPQSITAPAGGESAFRPPGYPLFLAAVYEVTGRYWNMARVIQAFLGALTAGLVGLIAWQLWGRRLVALVALAIAAAYPPLVLSSTALISEAVFLPLMLAAIAATLHYRRAGAGPGWAALAGALLGAAILVRPVALLLVVPLAFGLRLRPARWRHPLAAPAVMIAVCLAFVTPWIVRNAVVMDQLTMATEADYLLAGVYNPTARHDPDLPGAWRPVSLVPSLRPLLKDASLDESELSEKLRDRALDYLTDHPFYVLEAGFWNTLRLFDLSAGHGFAVRNYADVGQGRGAADWATYGFYGLAVVAILGAFTVPARRAPAWVWAVPVLLVAGVVFLAGGYARYRLPVEPFVVLLAALALAAAWDRLRRAETPRT
jgi:4-amino-4-deoxy-L-arabinose transferase-like glycosyltransferase